MHKKTKKVKNMESVTEKKAKNETANFSQTQWLVIFSIIIIDLLIGALFALTMGIEFLQPSEEISLYLSWLLLGGILAMPTTLLLKIGWPEKITTQVLLLPLRLTFAYMFLHGGIEKLLDPTYLQSPGLIGLGMAAGTNSGRE